MNWFSGRPEWSTNSERCPVIADVSSDQQNQGLEVALEIDRSTASRLGLSAAAIDNTLYDAFGQRQVSTIYKRLNQYHVVMGVDPRFWEIARESQIHLPEDDRKQQAPLSAFAKHRKIAHAAVRQSPGAVSIDHDFIQPDTGRFARRRRHGDQQAERDLLMPETVQGTFTGTAQAISSRSPTSRF